jgi:hypothetical protein
MKCKGNELQSNKEVESGETLPGTELTRERSGIRMNQNY